MLALLFTTLFANHALHAAPTFNDVVAGRYAALDEESARDRAAALDEARAFERHRQRGDREYVERCEAEPRVSRFCDVATTTTVESTSSKPSPEIRRTLFDALTRLDRPATRAAACPGVTEALDAVLADPDAGVLHSRARYWRWACATLTRDDAAAARFREELWTHHPLSDLTFEVLSADRDPRLTESTDDAGADFAVEPRDPGDERIDRLLRGVEALINIKADGAAAVVLKHVDARTTGASPARKLFIAALAARVARTIPSVRPVMATLDPLVTEVRDYMRRPVLTEIYPRPAYFAELPAARGTLDIALLAGLIHQESALYPRARSDVAYGLGQMKPSVATELNQQLGLFPEHASIDTATLFDPRVSLTLAAAYLAKLIAKFGGDERMGLAAYHSGPDRLAKWVAATYAFVDPAVRAHALYLDLPGPSSTAAYVLNVRGRARWYRALYGDDLSAP